MATVGVLKRRLDLVFVAAGPGGAHGGQLGFAGDGRRSAHQLEFGGALEQAQFVQQVAQFEEFMRRLGAVAHLRAHPVHPADELEVELGVAAEVVINARAPFQQARQDFVEVGDGIGVVHAVGVHRALGAGARAVPGFAFGVAFTAEKQHFAMGAARHQHQHRLGLGETAEVPEVAVLPIGIVRVVAAHAFRRGRQDEDGVLVGHAHQLLAAAREFGGFDHGRLS